MSIEHPDQVQWNKVAAELRAAREAQQRTWGDIDNTTLGRYLADEATSSEKAQVESALETLPELRLLTDLVRGVLAESGPAEPVAPVTVQAPAAGPPPETAPRSIPFVQKSRWAFSRRRAAALVAACLAVAVGTWAFWPGSSDKKSFIDLTALANVLAREQEHAAALQLAASDRAKEEAAARTVVARLDALQKKIENYQAEGDRETALAAARDYSALAANSEIENDLRFAPKVAAGWNQVGLLYREEGDIDQAERALAKANEINRKTLGENHKATRQTCFYLAAVYQDAVASRTHPGAAMMMHTAPPNPEPAMKDLSFDKSNHLRAESLARFRARMPEMRKHVQESVLPILTKALEDAQTAPERARLAIALGNLGELALDAEPVVVSRLERAKDPSECDALVDALYQMRQTRSEGAVRVLAQTLNKCEAEAARRSVANYLGLTPAGRAELTEWAAKGKEAEKQIAEEALLRPRGGR
jgi:tetratricopeptide (TPR) repeat protein